MAIITGGVYLDSPVITQRYIYIRGRWKGSWRREAGRLMSVGKRMRRASVSPEYHL